MKKLILTTIIAIGSIVAFTAPKTGEDVIKMMYSRYSGKWHKTLTFTQKTERYRNDSLKSTQTWHEKMLAPDKLRIDILPASNGNSIIFRGDSTYRISGGVLKSGIKDENDLIFLIGGMYFMKYDQVLSKLKTLSYDLSKTYESEWKGKPVYVIGTNDKNDLNSNQLWIDQKNLYLVRMIEQKGTTKEECIFDDHVRIGGGWSETKASFYFNGKLIQVETYSDYTMPASLDEKLFDPGQHVKK